MRRESELLVLHEVAGWSDGSVTDFIRHSAFWFAFLVELAMRTHENLAH